MPCLVYIATHSTVVRNRICSQLVWMRNSGFDVVVVAPPGEGLPEAVEQHGARMKFLHFEREIRPFRDLLTLGRLYRLLRDLRPEVVNAGNPKAGLLGMLAAWLAGVPVRIYTLRGLRLETTRGLKRLLLWASERLACSCAHRVICVSPSLRRKANELRLVALDRALVLGSGSSSGVDPSRFAPSRERLRRAAALRVELKIPDSAPVFGYLGRFTRDKGIVELVTAFRELKSAIPNLRLLLVGEFETGDPVPATIREQIAAEPHIIVQQWVDEPSAYYHLMDVFVLPTYREGLPNVALQAAAAGKPVVTTRATGAVDAVADGVSGVVVPVGSAESLAGAVARLLRNKNRAEEMGQAGRARVEREFRTERVNASLERLYRKLLQDKGLFPPRNYPEATTAEAVR